MNIKQDINMSRKPVDLETKYQLSEINPMKQEVEEIKEKVVVDRFLSATSTHAVENRVITEALNNKVNKEEGKGLSTNDFTNEYKNLIAEAGASTHSHSNKTTLDIITNSDILGWDNAVTQSHTHSNKNILDRISATDIENWNSGGSTNEYNLATYKANGLTILRGSCIEKNNRVCINFVGTISISANTTTTIFTLPTDICPTETKDFVVFGQSSNNDGYIGYGYVTADGLMQVRFNVAITSYIRFNFVYDLD